MVKEYASRPPAGDPTVPPAASGSPSVQAEQVDTEASRIRFVYPFTFDAGSIDARSAAIAPISWPGQRQPLTVWRPRSFPTEDLLPHVLDFLNPDLGSPRSTSLWRMEDNALRSPSGLGGGLTHPGAHWTLATRRAKVPFGFDAVELVLFEHGVGFLVIDAMPLTASTDDWFDFIHYFRYFAGARSSGVQATRVVGVDAAGESRSVAFVPPITGDRSQDGPARNTALFGLIIDALLRGMALEGETAQWWEDIYVPGMLIPHVALFIDNCIAPRIADHVYRVRNFFHSQQDVHPTVADSQSEDALLPYAANQWFFFSLNGGGFLACNAPRTQFFRANLPQHLTNQYFIVFLLALMQRFVLMRLSRRVSREWVSSDADGEGRKAAAFASIRDTLLAFTAQGYFAQTMQSEHHHRCYARWQRTFDLARLYAEVTSEVRDMYSYLDLRQRVRAEGLAKQQDARTQRVERRLQLVGWMFGVPVWLFIALNSAVNIALIRHLIGGPGDLQGYDPLISVGVFVVGLVVALIAYRLVSRVPRARRAGKDAQTHDDG
jgi:hypothetical protein